MYQPQLIEVDPQRIKFSPLNPRKHQGTEFDRLKQSVREVGMVQLPTVRVLPGGFYEVIDGEGRVRTSQEKQNGSMWAISLGVVSDQDALIMLQSANGVRSFSFLAECRGLANLHRQGLSSRNMSGKVGVHFTVIAYYVAIGYFPNHLLEMIQESTVNRDPTSLQLGYRTLYSLLPLRQLLPGKQDPSGSGVIEGAYDYTEVQRAVEKVIRGEIKTEDGLSAYVAERRRELFEEHFHKELREQLDIALAQTKQMLEESYTQQLQGVQEQTAKQYEAQVNALRKQYEELEQYTRKLQTDVARRPEVIEQREKQLQQKLKETEEERKRSSHCNNRYRQRYRKRRPRPALPSSVNSLRPSRSSVRQWISKLNRRKLTWKPTARKRISHCN